MTEQERTEQAEVFDEAIKEEEEIQAVGLALAPTDQGPARLLEMAVQQNLDIDKLERLVAMKERWDAQQAKVAFYEALTKFQKLVPSLIKDKPVDFTTKSGVRVKYDHTSLGQIKKQIQELAADCGLSYRWEFDEKETMMEVNCIITHIFGHSESSSMSAPEDTSGHKNTIQGRQSTRTYLERATLIGALGLMTADKDDDGRQGYVGTPKPEDAAPNLPPLPKGTDTKAPKPETPGKSDFEKQRQLYGYLIEICGTDDAKTLSVELEALTEFESDGKEIEGEKSLRHLKGRRLNVAIGKAKAKLAPATVKEELKRLLQNPALLKALGARRINDFIKAAEKEGQDEQWFLDQLPVIKGFIADAEKEQS